MLRAGRTAGVFQFESPLATDMLREHALRPLRRSRRVERADAPGPARRGHARRLHAPQARRGAGVVRAARARADPRADVRRHHLSGTGDAHRAGARRHLARRSRRAAQGRRQEGRGADPARSSASSSRRRSRRGYDRRRSSRSSRARSRRSAATASTSRTRSPTRSSRTTRRGSRRTIPAEFMAALLSSSIGDTDSVVKYINEARELGHRGAAARRQRVRLQVHRHRREARSASGSARFATSAAPRSTRSSPRAGRTAVHVVCSISASESTCASATSACSRRSSTPARWTRSAAIARRSRRRSTWPSTKRRSSRRTAATGQVSLFGAPVDDAQRPHDPAFAAERPAVDRIRAPGEGKGDSRLLHLRSSARAVPHRVRALRDAHRVAARQVDAPSR